jgi:hypothetical protein
MAADWLAIMEGLCLFSLVALLPGYAFGWLTNVLRFRTRTLPFRAAASVPLSITVGPILSYTVGRWFSLDAVWGVYACLGIYTLYLAARIPRAGLGGLVKRFRVFLALIASWVLIAMLSLADMQIGRRLYFSVIAFDYAVRTAFTQAIGTYGIPARNPFFFPGHPVGLRYHYFWIILCGLVHRLGYGFVDARQAFIAGTIWCGIGLICLIPLYLRIFSAAGDRDLHRRSLIGIALLGVTGLDIVPALLMLRFQAIGVAQGVSPSVEWWNNQVDGWLYTMLWEPHYLCAVIACFTAFLILWDASANSSWRGRALPAAVAGLGFASAVGAGIYVAFVFSAFLAIWTLIAIFKKWYRDAFALAIAGAVAIAFSIPYLHSLGTSSGHSDGSLFQLTVRTFDLGEFFMRLFGLDRPWQLAAGDFLMLPLNYFLELGFFFAAGLIVLSAFRKIKGPATRRELAAFAMLATSILICTFVKSGIISNNDLGWRGFLIAQFVLLLWGAEVLPGSQFALSRRRKIFLKALVAVGVAGVAYDLAILRFFPVLSDSGRVPKIGWLANDQQLGPRTYANREAYEWLRARTSPRASIQQNPDPGYQDTFFGMYGQRQTVAGDRVCGTGFGGDPDECKPIFERLQKIYSASQDSTGQAADFESACLALPVDVFVAKDTDAAWRDRSSWIWTRPPIFQNGFVRLFACHPL